MRILIDTSSLLSLVKYYLPFDKNTVLFNFFKNKIALGEIIVIDKVALESSYLSKGIILKELEYLKEKKSYVKTDEVLPTNKFFNQLENQFCFGKLKNQLTTTEFENLKNLYLDSADAKLILLALKMNKPSLLIKERVIIVTEETEIGNDNKVFKKIPAICKILEIETLSLPKFLKLYDEIDFEIK